MPIMAFLCHFYGWSFQDCLKLPIKAFFAFYKQAVVMEARQYREHLAIGAVPIMNLEYFAYLRDKYEAIINPQVKELPKSRGLGPVLKAGSPEAKVAIMSVFARMKRDLGHGKR